jgi:hypothetical protein
MNAEERLAEQMGLATLIVDRAHQIARADGVSEESLACSRIAFYALCEQKCMDDLRPVGMRGRNN